MPCFAGHAPVIIVVWLGYVTVGTTPRTPLAYVPSFRNRRRFGIFSPWASAPSTYSGLSPSIETRTTGVRGFASCAKHAARKKLHPKAAMHSAKTDHER